MNTKEICRRLSVTTKMLRVYEDGGLIHPERGDNNYREYSEEDVLRIQLIVMLRNLGFSVKEIERIFREKEDQADSVLYAFYFQLKAIEMQQCQLTQNHRNITAAINQMLAGTDPMESLKQSETSPMYEMIRDQWNFDEMAENYVQRFLEKDLAYQSGIEDARNFLRTLPQDCRILDVGGGTCHLWEELPEFRDVTILDNSLPMLLSGRQNFPGRKYVLGDVAEPAAEKILNGEHYDVVISTFLLHHIAYPFQERAVDRLLGWTKPGGVLYIVDRCFLSQEEKQCRKWIYQEMEDRKGLRSVDTEYFLIVGDFCDMLKRKGCSVEMKKTGAFVRSFRITVNE